MAPLRDYLCLDCGHQAEEFIKYELDEPTECSHCEGKRLERLPAAVGGYHISGGNPGSTRPKFAGSFKKASKLLILGLLTTNSVIAHAESKPTRKEVRSAIAQAVVEVNKSILVDFQTHNRIHGLVPFRLLLAICTVESSLKPRSFNPHDSHGGSYGLCQLKEDTAKSMGFNADKNLLLNMHVNAYYAARYLSHQLERYDDDWIRAIAGYNKGSSEFSISNQDYVNKVLAEAVKE